MDWQFARTSLPIRRMSLNIPQNERMTQRSDFFRARRIPLRIVLETHLCFGGVVDRHRVAIVLRAQPRMWRDELMARGTCTALWVNDA